MHRFDSCRPELGFVFPSMTVSLTKLSGSLLLRKWPRLIAHTVKRCYARKFFYNLQRKVLINCEKSFGQTN